VGTRILHVSDLHVGAQVDPLPGPQLGELISRVTPEVLVVTGDLTHRGRHDQHERAAAFLRGFGVRVVAIPGNHDIPYTFPARFTTPWREFEREWSSTEPLLATESLYIVGLNSVRPWRHQSGGVDDAQLARVRGRLAEAAPRSLRVVALHHQLIGAPWRSRKRPVARRDAVLAALVESGAELIVAGHIHQAAVSERHEFEAVTEPTSAVVVSIAPGLGQPRPRRRGEARGCMVYDATERTLDVETYVLRKEGLVLAASRRFPRGRSTLPIPPPEAPG